MRNLNSDAQAKIAKLRDKMHRVSLDLDFVDYRIENWHCQLLIEQSRLVYVDDGGSIIVRCVGTLRIPGFAPREFSSSMQTPYVYMNNEVFEHDNVDGQYAIPKMLNHWLRCVLTDDEVIQDFEIQKRRLELEKGLAPGKEVSQRKRL